MREASAAASGEIPLDIECRGWSFRHSRTPYLIYEMV
jgi:hypothetical protein